MAKTWIIVLAIVAVLIIAGVLLTQKQETARETGESSGGEISAPGEGSGEAEETPETPPQVPETPKTYNAEIKNYAFNPVTLRIKKGDTVIWTNKDDIGHTVTSDTGKELASTSLQQGQTYTKTFNTAGEFKYHCIPHPWMQAKIIVE